jgi:hypothetical protein
MDRRLFDPEPPRGSRDAAAEVPGVARREMCSSLTMGYILQIRYCHI